MPPGADTFKVPGAQPAFIPSFDIRETPDAYVFEADMPGIQLEDLEINLTGNRLTVHGKRESTAQREEGNFFTMERSFGVFTRFFNLPDGADPSRIKADLENGVLTIAIPKTPEVQPRKISVSHGKHKHSEVSQGSQDAPEAAEARA
ncbi:MAG: HSP20 family small heat-shock protein [Holophaga sp.]|jgi:HSP20 family protein